MKKFYFMFIYLVLGCSVIFSQQPWFIENSGTTEDLNQVLYSNAKLIGIGDNGTYISSTNSGESWVSFNTGFNYNFNFFVTMSNYTFIACDGGNIIRSTNSGISWIQLNTGINSNINSIAFSSPRLFAACENGAILLSTNNGSNWIMNYNAGSALNSISFYANIVFAGGDNGIIYRSANQGNNWSQLSTGTGSNINFITQRILFADSSFYYVCGENGLLLKTSNMGLNWITINTGYNYNFTSVSRLNNNIFLSSTEGKILLSTNTGYTWSIDYNGSVPLNHFNITVNRGVGNNGLILYRYPNDHLKNYRMIDANSISTFYTNFSQFNNDFHNFKSGFEWPKGENKYARYASGIWIGAVVENDTLVAITEYNDYEFYPGFTDNTGIPLGKLDSNFKVYKIAGDINSNDRNKWPNVLLGNSDQGAPVFFDSLSGIWKPLDFGAQTLFTSYTDSYLESHSNYIGNTLPLKADIKLLSYSFIYPGALNYAIINRYMVINRSNKVWNNFYFSLWTDDDVGDANDDMVACDTNLNFGYTYNGDNSDIIYGTAPPAVGFLILKGPAVYTGNNNDTSWICNANNKIIRTGYKDRKMDVYFNYLKNHYIYGNPRNYRESYRIIKGLTRDGSAIINPITNKPTTFMYSGDPVTGTGWITGPILPGDQHFLISTGPVNMNPGDTQYIVIAQIIARGTSNLNSVAVLRQYVQDIKNYYNNCFAGVPIGIEPISNIIPERFELYQNYPNPFNPYTVISFQCTMYNKVMIKIYDVMGREVEMLVNEQLQPGKYKVAWDGSKYASGVYYYSLSAGDNLIGTRKMVLMK